MAAPRNRRHVVVPTEPTSARYQPQPRRIETRKAPAPASRPLHGRELTRAILEAAEEAKRRRSDAGIEVFTAKPGVYVQFESQPGVPLKVAALADTGKGIEVVAVTYAETGAPRPGRIERATVFVPEGKVGHFLSRFESYAKTGSRKKGERRHEDMLDPVATLRLATLRSLWTDANDTYPANDEGIWWEVWLRRHDGLELQRLMEFADIQGVEVSLRRLQFDDRIVTLVRATPELLAASIDVLNDVAELRRAKETATVFQNIDAGEQHDWASELLARTTAPGPDAPAVCILDTGVTRGHPLLEGALAATDCHAYDPNWGANDHHGHGTEMAGLALYGDLAPVLAGSDRVRLRHCLESVKILPPRGANAPELYGAITAEATSRVEIEAPLRRRCFSMAIAATDERDRGQPTSWSAAVDALAAGRSFDTTTQGLVYLDDGEEPHRRLFVLCAGNVAAGSLKAAHLDQSDTEPVHDPGQAWNALTVGAFTDKALVRDPNWAGWQAVAPAGDLSPWSTTGVVFVDAWPLKPDVVFEGGNIVKDGAGAFDFPCPDVCLLSTHYQPATRSFTLTWATSAATAQAARMAAIISSEYPSLWPETVRALVVHSAEWTPAMQGHFGGARTKAARARLVRRYGFGVPGIGRALRSANDSLTLIVQSTIRPFNDGALGDMHLWDLPWPTSVLESLGDVPATLRVTLSYFIEPNPGRRGWKNRYRYASHSLRFDVKGPTESLEEFRKRRNKLALEEDEEKPSTGGDPSDWYLGEARHHGSIHSDILRGTAAQLAQRGAVCVYPVGGWWKDLPKRDRSEKGARYALIVSIETPGVETDIWTPVAEQVGLPVTIET